MMEHEQSADDARETGAFTCPAADDGEHGLQWDGDWFCPACHATLRLGVWLLNDGSECA